MCAINRLFGEGKEVSTKRKWDLTSQPGFTLIELLISVLLLSFMLTLASVALRNLLLSFDRLSSPYPENAISFYRLQSAVQGMFPYVVYEPARTGVGRKTEARFFFEGTTRECVFVTLTPLRTAEPSVCRIYLQGDRILLDEAPLFSAQNNFMEPSSVRFNEPVVLFRMITELEFTYEYKMATEKTRWYAFPATVTMTMKDSQGRSRKNVFVVKSNFYEKVQLIQLLQDNV